MNDDHCPPALHYHDQAQRIRHMAETAHSDETRRQFLALAEQYERLAGQALKTSAAGHEHTLRQ